MIRRPTGAVHAATVPVFVAIVLAVAANPALAQTPYLDRFLGSNEPVVLTADKVTYDVDRDTYRAEGRVELRQGEMFLRAERLLVDMKEMSLSADGDVSLGNREGEIRSPTIHINFNTQRGVIVQGDLVARVGEVNYYLRGEKIEKVGPNHFLITNGWYSTCDCGNDEADWFIEADQIDVTLDGYALVRRGRVYTAGLPVAYVPFGVVPAKITRQTGFLSPRVGWSSDDGYHFGVPFFWAISDNMDATFYTDVYEKRGIKEGFEYRYALSRSTSGQFDLDFIDDHKYGDDRWAIAYEHNQNVARRLYLRNNTNLVSDKDYVIDFPTDITARYDRFLRSNTIFNNLWQNYSANLNFEYFDSLDNEDNSYTWQKLPEVGFDALARRIGPLPVGVRAGTMLTNFYRPKVLPEERAIEADADRTRSFWYGTAAKRLDVLPEVFVPVSFDRYAFLTPSVEWRETFYELPDRPREERYEARHLYTARAHLFTRTERVWPIVRPILKGFKHTIEPGVEYAYTPPADQDELPIIDGEDRISRENSVTYYLANRAWLRVLPWRGKNRMTVKLADLRISQSFDIYESQRKSMPENEDREPFGPIRGDLESTATFGMWLNKVVVRSRLDYDTYSDRVSNFNVLGALGSVNDDTIGVEYRYQLEDDEEFNLQFVNIDYLSAIGRYTLLDFLTFSYLGRYSFLDDTFIERIYGIQFNSLQNCWSLGLQLEKREIPEPEDVYRITLDMTGLVQAGTAF